ncbi:MAG: cytochrome c oxidase subunit 4 [Actinomycetota bacterium]|nr:cytochrome c oxidase subunit 4 [Actinomycetota bacterium]
MSTVSRIFLALALFLAVAGVVYGLTAHEREGATELIVGAATVCFLGLVARTEARREAASEGSEEAEVHVAPTIWPFGFAIAAVILAIGLVVTPWILILGGLMFVLSAAGWLRDVSRSHAHVSGS